MIQHPVFISLILLLVVIAADTWSRRFKDSFLMRIIPTPVWCYIPPTILTTFGILPSQSPVYDWISAYVLPACLILLLMTSDLKSLSKIGTYALVAMFGSSCAVLIGGVSVFFLFKSVLGAESWKAIATLAASWIGGTANQLAVKQATGLSDSLFTPLFISDITMVYVWMTFLMILSSRQEKIDVWMNSNRKQLEKILHDSGPEKSADQNCCHPEAIFGRRISDSRFFASLRMTACLLILGFGIGFACTWAGGKIPELGLAVNRATWTIIIITTVGLLLSLTSFARSQESNANKIGYFFFYFVLASTGAKANLLAVLLAPLFLGIAFIWMLIQGVLFFVYARILRIPIGLSAAASQANLGGIVSAPIVASTYDSKLVPVALILAIFGNAIGNYVGILTAQFLKLF